MSKIKIFASSLLSSTPTLRDLSSFIGMVNVFVPAFSLALIYFRSLQLLGSHVRKKSPWYSRVSLDDDSRRNLLWWSSCSFPLPGSLLSPPFYDFSLTTDASLTGWSGILSSGELLSGIWSDVESSYHINLLELTAVYNSFLAFSDLLQGSRVQVFSDNYTTVSFLKKEVPIPKIFVASLSLFGISCWIKIFLVALFISLVS